VVEDKAVVENAHFQVWKTKVVHAVLRQLFPVADSVIRNVADCSADKTEFAVWNRLVFEQRLKSLEWVNGLLSCSLACFFISDLDFAVFGLDGYFWVEPDE
jgi:hypothetical protein